jgi:2'-5' RNA ligase
MRLFIAVELPAEARQKIAELTAELKQAGAAVKWVAEENLHLTLKFIGEVAEGKVVELLAGVEAKVGGTGSFLIKLEGLGTFPEGKHPRVVWVGISRGSERLEELARALDEKEFVAHATIGRIKDNKGVDKLLERLGKIKGPQFGEAVIASVMIMKSTLTPHGPIYEKIKEVKL